jgi:hypothetical protein
MFHRVIHNNNSSHGEVEDLRVGNSQTQQTYMQTVRERNRMNLFAKYGGRYALRPVARDVESQHGSVSQY